MRAPQQLTGPRQASARSNTQGSRLQNSRMQGRRAAVPVGSTGQTSMLPRGQVPMQPVGQPMYPGVQQTPFGKQMPPNMPRLRSNLSFDEVLTMRGRATALQSTLNQEMANNPLIQDIRRRQSQLTAALRGRQDQYIQSLGIPLDQMSGPLRELVNIGLNRWQQGQPEFRILQNLANSQKQVMQQYYGPTIQELERIGNLTNQYFNSNQLTQEQIQRLRQVELQNRGQTISLTEDLVNATPTPSYNENLFNQQSSYEIRDGRLYKDGRFLGTIGGGMFGGGNAGQNQIVMGNDAVIDVPDWVFETAEQTETPTSVGTSPVTQTPTQTPIQTTGGLGPLADIFGGSVDQTQVPVTPVEQPTKDPIVDPKVPPMYVDPGVDKPLVPKPVPTPIVEDNKAPVRMPRPEPIRETKYPRQNPRPRPRPRPGLASPSNQQG